MTAPQHERGILDTNAVIRLGEVDPLQLAVESLITTVTLAELSVGPLLTSDRSVFLFRQRGPACTPLAVGPIENRSFPNQTHLLFRIPEVLCVSQWRAPISGGRRKIGSLS
jgi:hypothetical protein